MVRNASRHRRCDAERFVDSCVVIVHQVNRYRCRVVLNFLGEAVRQPCEAAHPHARGEVRTFDIRRGDMLGIGIAYDILLFAADTLSGAVSLLALGVFAVDFMKLRIVDMAVKSSLYGLEICVQSIRCQLNPVGKATREIIDKDSGGDAITGTDDPRWNQFCVSVNRHPGPAVTRKGILCGDLWRDVLRLGIAKRPNLIDLYALARQVLKVLIEVGRASRTDIHQELRYGVNGDIGHAASRTQAIALHQHSEDLGAFGKRKPIHTQYFSEIDSPCQAYYSV